MHNILKERLKERDTDWERGKEREREGKRERDKTNQRKKEIKSSSQLAVLRILLFLRKREGQNRDVLQIVESKPCLENPFSEEEKIVTSRCRVQQS